VEGEVENVYFLMQAKTKMKEKKETETLTYSPGPTRESLLFGSRPVCG
tara:strand:+ start:431 stop:574 length:144 start_codon:yes stop_codon:yes gene_type:complete